MGQPAIIKIKIRTGTEAEWTAANPTLLEGEYGFISDNNRVIIGNGSSPYLNLIDSFHFANQIANYADITSLSAAFQTALGNEVTNRENADGDLQDAIDAINLDVTTINGNISTLQGDVIAIQTELSKLDLTLTAKGQLLILDENTGQYTPLNVGSDGQVLTADSSLTNGIKWSDIPTQPIPALDDLSDVNLNSNFALANGDLLTYDAAHNEWTNEPYPYIPAALNDLSDVNAPAPNSNDILVFNGTEWVNAAPTTYGDMYKATYDTDNDGVVDYADAAKKMITIGRNATGVTLYKGTIVYISGSTGNRPNFVKARANVESTSAGTFGVIIADIANNSDGYAATIGTLDNLDTRTAATNPFTSDTLADGDTIYLSPTTAGYVTNVKPSAPNHLVYVGKVVRTSPTQGTIVYRIQNGYELNELHDVQAQSPANNDVLYYDNSSTQWKTSSIAAIAGTASAVNTGLLSSTDYSTFSNKLIGVGQFRKSGRWYNSSLFGMNNLTTTNVANTILYMPFIVDVDITITRLGINVTGAGAAASTSRLGIYTNDAATCQPSTRLVDSGTLAMDSTGQKIVTGLSVALTKGLYWFAFVTNTATGSISAVSVSSMFDVKGQTTLGALAVASLNQSFTYAALPATAGTLTEGTGTVSRCIFYYY